MIPAIAITTIIIAMVWISYLIKDILELDHNPF